MKKIIFLLFIIITISSCGITNKKNWEEKQEKIVKQEINKTTKQEKLVKLEDQINKQEFDKAIPELEKMYNQNPEDLDNILNYSQALLAKWSITRQEKEYSKKAIEILNKALKKYPKESEIYRLLWYANEIAENYKDAFENYDKAIELNPENALAYANRWHAYRLYWDYDKAIKNFLKAYKINPKNNFVLINLAWIYNIDNDFPNAIKFYKEAIKNNKNIRFRAEAYHSIWQIYMGKWRYKEAEDAFRSAIKSDEKFELWYLWLSELEMFKFLYQNQNLSKEEKLKLVKDALKNNEIAIALNPTRAKSYLNKWLILREIDKENSDFVLKLALDVIPNDITLWKKEKENLKVYISNLLKNEKK